MSSIATQISEFRSTWIGVVEYSYIFSCLSKLNHIVTDISKFNYVLSGIFKFIWIFELNYF